MQVFKSNPDLIFSHVEIAYLRKETDLHDILDQFDMPKKRDINHLERLYQGLTIVMRKHPIDLETIFLRIQEDLQYLMELVQNLDDK